MLKTNFLKSKRRHYYVLNKKTYFNKDFSLSIFLRAYRLRSTIRETNSQNQPNHWLANFDIPRHLGHQRL